MAPRLGLTPRPAHVVEDTYDAIVIGAGPNGLVAANHLLDQGWSVLVLEAQPTPGGAVRSDSDVATGFVHDTFSAFYPLAAASPNIQAFGLEEHGLRWVHAPAVVGHPRADGSWALLHRDRNITAELMDDQHLGSRLTGPSMVPCPGPRHRHTHPARCTSRTPWTR